MVISIYINMKYIINSTDETKKIAEEFILSLSPKESSATVVGLYGDLGAGKTNYTQHVAKILGIEENIVSPTFVIEKIYPIRNKGLEKPISNETSELQQSVVSSQHLGKFKHLIHIDTYRLEKSEELLHLGWKEIISNPENLILIEWPERVADIMPEHSKIMIKHLENETSREIEIKF